MAEAFDAFDTLVLSPPAARAIAVLAAGSLILLLGAVFRGLK